MDRFPEFVQDVVEERQAVVALHEVNRTGWENVRFQVDEEPKPVSVKRGDRGLKARLDALERDVRRSGSRCGDGTSTDRCSPGTSPGRCT
jgi:hypothetical protein